MEDSNRFRCWASSWTTSGDLAGINSANLSGVIDSATIRQPDVLNISGSTSISLHENIWKSLNPPTSLVCWDETLFYIQYLRSVSSGDDEYQWPWTMRVYVLGGRNKENRSSRSSRSSIFSNWKGVPMVSWISTPKVEINPGSDLHVFTPCHYAPVPFRIIKRIIQDLRRTHGFSSQNHPSSTKIETMWNHQPDHHWVPMISPWYPHDIPIHVHSESVNLSTPRCAKSWCSGREHA